MHRRGRASALCKPACWAASRGTASFAQRLPSKYSVLVQVQARRDERIRRAGTVARVAPWLFHRRAALCARTRRHLMRVPMRKRQGMMREIMDEADDPPSMYIHLAWRREQQQSIRVLPGHDSHRLIP